MASRFWLVGTLTLLVVGAPHAAGRAADNAAAEARLLSSLQYLADDERDGRGIGTEGLDEAAEYIASRFAELGLKTDLFSGQPFQEFQVTVKTELGPTEKNRLAILPARQGEGENAKATRWKHGQDFNTLAIGGTGQVQAPLVFVGYGITAPEHEYDDYAGIDVKGKVVLILRKEPQQDNPHSAFDGDKSSRHAFFQTKISNAFSHGAAAVILVNDAQELVTSAAASQKAWDETVDSLTKLRAEFQAQEKPTDQQTREHRQRVGKLVDQIRELGQAIEDGPDQPLPLEGAGADSSHRRLPVFFATRAAVGPVLKSSCGKSLEELEAAIDDGPTPRSQELSGIVVDCESNVVFVQATARNVAGVLEGEGPLADETVIVGAHYDHLGNGGPGSLAPWTRDIHNGADDNASGTAALLEVARSLATSGAKPPRRIVFMAFSGEERGLLGSAHYVKNPALSLERTVAMVNMDMVGRLNENKLIVHGTGTAESFDALIDDANKPYEFDIKKEPGGFGPSDHASFYGAKIPVFHFFTGTHSDYHRPSDDVEKINVAGMQRVASLVTDVVNRVAATPDRPKYVEIKGRHLGGGDRPYLGSIPDFGREVEGYAAMGVSKDSPAEKAGMKAGDVIIKFGDSKIAGLEDIDTALRKYKAGDKVPVVVLRDGKEVTLDVTLASPR